MLMRGASPWPSRCRAHAVFFYLDVNGVGNNPFSPSRLGLQGWTSKCGRGSPEPAAQRELRNEGRVKTSSESGVCRHRRLSKQ